VKKSPLEFDFTRALARGPVSYDARVGEWWDNQSTDKPHQRAYRHIAEYVTASLRKKKIRSPLIVDYACGSGHFLIELAKLLPEARIVGLDGSKKMLALTMQRCAHKGVSAETLPADLAFASAGPQVRLVQTKLPNFKLPQGKADAVAFVFPNIAPAPSDQGLFDRNGYLNRADSVVGQMLARFREMDPEDEVTTEKPEFLFDGFMTERVLSRNIRGFLKKGGLWFKIDYANAPRAELSQLSQWRSLFSECALGEPIKEKKAEQLFVLRGNEFRRSSVILDVYHQTKDESDKTGGYFVTEFEAV
jgi:SAM-dependent methyltransferase